MNCKRVEALMPLYAGGDTDGRTAGKVQAHLTTCERCAALAAEYEASRNWMSGATPELDEALLLDMKRGVMREIQTASSRASLFEVIKRALAQAVLRPAVALALLLIVAGGLALWIYVEKRGSTRPIEAVVPEVAAPAPVQDANSSVVVAAPNIAKKAPRASHNPRSARLAGAQRPASKGVSNEPRDIRVPDVHEQERPQTVAVESEMLRIEMQTADPSIRIIWFAPRETETQQIIP